LDPVDLLKQLASAGGYGVLCVFVVLSFMRKICWGTELEDARKQHATDSAAARHDHEIEIERLLASCERERKVLTDRAEVAERHADRCQELTTEMVRHSSRMAEITRTVTEMR
jgi:hypothetical protein